jgi:dTDP-4-dehydrorhamnose reductase
MTDEKRRVLVLGAAGMLGHAMLQTFAGRPDFAVTGSVRSAASLARLPAGLRPHVVADIDVESDDAVSRLLSELRPHAVINCIGVVKQLSAADDPLVAIPINSVLPHRLARQCAEANARLVHISTDCVFAGTRGNYLEGDAADATDLYGRSKLLGEVDYPNAVTLRTSIIGPELGSAHGLVGWFLSEQGRVRGFTRAIFSGLPTVELARVVGDHVLRLPDMRGVYHVSAAPISKYDLLNLIRAAYGRTIEIEPDDRLVIDRSLDSTRFRTLTGWHPAAWPDLIAAMRAAD